MISKIIGGTASILSIAMLVLIAIAAWQASPDGGALAIGMFVFLGILSISLQPFMND